MAEARIALPGTSTDGLFWEEADVNEMVGGWLGYAEIQIDTGTFTTIEDVTSLEIPVTINDDRAIELHAHCAVLKTTGAGYIKGHFREGSTTLDLFGDDTLSINGRALMDGSTIDLGPTAGSHTYIVSMEAANAEGQIKGSASQKAWILCSDIGPAA